MATECYTQLGFGFQPKLRVDFSGGALTSDAGLVLVREFDHRHQLTADVVRRVADERDRRYICHEMATLVRQRIYQIVAGYEDANDADRLRHDPTLQVVAGDGRTPLGSQPTLSRLENSLDWTTLQRLSTVGVDWFCRYAYARRYQPREVILDVDSTADPTHGTQQLALFHGGFEKHMYHPLCWFEGHTGLLLRTRLRPGLDRCSSGLVEDLNYLLPKLRRRFPRATLLLRGDAGMATPRVEEKLEAEGIGYVLGIGVNPVFRRRAAPALARAQARYARTGQPAHMRTSFWHRAQSWPHRRRILIKVDVTALGINLRFLVTNRRGRAADLIGWYEARGESENWIKELKRDVQMDRLSCHRYRANAARLQLHSLAHLLVAHFRRRVLSRTALADATVGTLRVQLFKVGACVRRTVRKLWFHLASHWPGRTLFVTCHGALARAAPA